MRMLNCRDASKLTSEALDYPLSWSKRVALKFHLGVCKYCKRYADQLSFIHRVVDLGRNELESLPEDSTTCLSYAAKERIRDAMRQQ